MRAYRTFLLFQVSDGASAVLKGSSIHGNGSHGVWFPVDGAGRLIDNKIWHNGKSGIMVEKASFARLQGNVLRDNKEFGAYAADTSGFNASAARVNFFEHDVGDLGGPGWKKILFEARDEGEWGAIAAWWDAQNTKRLRAARGGRRGEWVFPPDAFDVTVAPGRDVQAAVKRCPRGGSVLLLPGVHEGPLDLTAGKTVHVFGRGRAVLRADWPFVLDYLAHLIVVAPSGG